MAQLTVNVPKPSLVLAGTTTVNGTMKWTPPTLPSVASGWDSVVVTGMWTWTGKGNVNNLTIGSTQTSPDIAFSHTLTASEIQNASIPLTARGNNKNTSGDLLSWSNLIVTYNYTDGSTASYMKINGVYEKIDVYMKVGGHWVLQNEQPNIGDYLLQYESDIPIGVNQFDRTGNGYEVNGKLNASGVWTAWAPGSVSNYMKVDPKCVYNIRNGAFEWNKLFFYDAGYNLISAPKSLLYEEYDYLIGRNTSYPIPENAVYLRTNAFTDSELYFERVL